MSENELASALGSRMRWNNVGIARGGQRPAGCGWILGRVTRLIRVAALSDHAKCVVTEATGVGIRMEKSVPTEEGEQKDLLAARDHAAGLHCVRHGSPCGLSGRRWYTLSKKVSNHSCKMEFWWAHR